MDVVFDVELEGAGLETVTGGRADKGRMVGGLIGGTMVELLSLGAVPASPVGPHIGYTNMSLRVESVDAAHAMLERSGDVVYTPPVDIGGVRMLFVRDPDGTPIELVELPGGATTTDQMWRASTRNSSALAVYNQKAREYSHPRWVVTTAYHFGVTDPAQGIPQ